MTEAINGAGGADWGQPTTSAAGSSDVSKDAFLKLLTTQIAYQNPLDPMDNKQFMSQLAQFAALEQAMETNARLGAIVMQQIGLANTAVASLVGREVTIKGSVVALKAGGFGTEAHYSLEAPAVSTTVVIRDSAGREVRRIDAGPRPEGAVRTVWDGKDEHGNLQPPGAYTVSVEAKGENGAPVAVTQETTGKLVFVSFEGGYPTLHLDNGATGAASDLVRVGEAVDSTASIESEK
jgi:flagellar basal-body rod modification protein FlgD